MALCRKIYRYHHIYTRVYVCAETKEITNYVTRNGSIVPQCYRDSRLVEYRDEEQEKCNRFSAFDLNQ